MKIGFEKTSVNNRVGRKIEATKLEIETMIEMKLDEIKAYHMKNIDFLDMKILDITSTKPFHILNNQLLIL